MNKRRKRYGISEWTNLFYSIFYLCISSFFHFSLVFLESETNVEPEVASKLLDEEKEHGTVILFLLLRRD